ncbi:MAG TPA: L-ribulose-5-phosphate 4-epimerase [Bacillus sp. (in: firmicutes)]|uniref:L-ribulose-5-phosphate 4-epimerase n=1 Tax=Bacillus litorisediminis TaxID=2922713 RepID=UPI001FAC2204|nr:L-ribulose-5-phosphate 4-epimerase [Bacillus litorisediminis]HWO78205.1 L-ribulose-5-phosphate 4-epimerase [Bacillus sp. (in: firmicutes)]
MLEDLKKLVCKANKSLKELNLVKWTSGNVSYRDPESNKVIIKPSGVHFDELKPEDMVVVDLDGNIIEGHLKPSVDTASHLYVYRNRDDIHSVVHTHSPFATSFAIRGKDIPSYTTTAANMFKDYVPCSDFAAIGEEEIGKQIVDLIGTSPAVLLRNHGVFTVGTDVEQALKAAVILEETAEYAHYATLHEPDIMPLSKDIIAQCNHFYKTSYGQTEKKTKLFNKG